MYGWIINKDHLSTDQDGEYNITDARYGQIPDGVKGVSFKLYDDDDILYYSGTFYSDNPDWDYDEETYNVLAWAMNYAGAISMRFPGHPEWDLG